MKGFRIKIRFQIERHNLKTGLSKPGWPLNRQKLYQNITPLPRPMENNNDGE